MTTMLDHALHYAELGMSVVPVHSVREGRCSCGDVKCDSPGKHPRFKWRGQSKVSLSAEEVERWWRRYPDSNIGIATGEVSNLVVIDIDGSQGLKALQEIGIDIDQIETPVVQSGGGGLHLYCLYPENPPAGLKTKAGVLKKVDIRANGGLIIAPPSLHESGQLYSWVEGMSLDDLQLLDVDLSWALSESNGRVVHVGRTEEHQWFEQILRGVDEGSRNESATKLAGRWLGMGLTAAEVLLILEAWNSNNDPPLPRREIETIVSSISDREDARADQLTREEALKKISQTLKLDVLDIRRITGDDPQFILTFKEGTCQINTKSILNPASFQSSVAEATKIVVRKLSHKTFPKHADLAQWIMDASRDEDAGDEATVVGEIRALMQDYVESQRLTTLDTDAGVPSRGCFKFGPAGATWVGLSEFIQWCGTTKQVRLSIKQTAQTFKALKWQNKSFNTDVGGTRSVWNSSHG